MYDDEDYENAVINAAATNNLDFIRSIMERTNYVRQDSFALNTAVVEASQHGHLEVVKYLITGGVRVFDSSSLRMSIRHGHLEVAHYLVESAGIDVDAVGDDDIQVATEKGYRYMVDYITALQSINHNSLMFATPSSPSTAATSSTNVATTTSAPTDTNVIIASSLIWQDDFFWWDRNFIIEMEDEQELFD